MKPVKIRRCRPEEIQEVTRLNNQGKREVKDWSTYSVREMREFLNFKDLILVAESEGRIVGLITGYHYTFVPPLTGKWGRKCIGVDNLYVRKGFRGKGVGKALVREFSRRWKERGCKYMEISVSEKSKLAFYRKFGFRKLLYLPYQRIS